MEVDAQAGDQLDEPASSGIWERARELSILAGAFHGTLNGHGVVLGSRVAVPIAGDFYVQVTVQAVRNDMIGNEFVTVKFDDNTKGECPSSQIVGNGFKSIHDIKLHKNQKVFTTHNGREVVCSVEEHSDGQVLLNLANSDESLRKREEDIRLVENRYSPRLQDHNHDPDYRRIASENASPNHGKKRTVSASIEVPKPGRPRKWSTEPSMDELMAAMVLSNLSSSPVFHNPRSPTNFFPKRSSPHSFGSSGVGSWGQDTQWSPVRGEPMSQTLGIPVDQSTPPERTRSVIQHTHSIEHSPSSTGDPIEVDTSTAMDTSVPMDEDCNNDDASSIGVVPPGHSTPAPFQSGSPSGQYLSAQGSSPSHNPTFLAKSGSVLESVKEEPNDKGDENSPSAPAYEEPRVFYIPPGRPEYMVHLPMVDTPPPPLAAADERQYRELFGRFVRHPQFQADVRGTASPSNAYIYIGSPSSNFYSIPGLGSSAPLSSDLTYASAPRAPSPLAARNDRDTPPYQCPPLGVRSHPIKMPSHLLPAHAQPINIPGMKAFSWHTTGAPQCSPKPSIMMQRQHMHQSASPKMSYTMTPKTLPSGRKVRGDGKKCRKVYGMENRDMWCTACRWKKACQRFPD